MYLTKDMDSYYINILFKEIPVHTFNIDGAEVVHETIKYRKTELGHLVQIPITKDSKKFEMKSGLSILASKNIIVKENPEKLMMFSSFTPALVLRIQEENPDILIVFIPPSTQYQTTEDFFKGQLFQNENLRLMHLVGESEFESSLSFPEFTLTSLKKLHKTERPIIISNYSPLAGPQNEVQFQELAGELRRENVPVIFLSSHANNLIQQIPKAYFGFPSYEFSVKNQFLTFNDGNASPWEVFNEFNSDFFVLKLDFTGPYWHILLQGKDENGTSIFERDLTLYKTRLK